MVPAQFSAECAIPNCGSCDIRGASVMMLITVLWLCVIMLSHRTVLFWQVDSSGGLCSLHKSSRVVTARHHSQYLMAEPAELATVLTVPTVLCYIDKRVY